VASVAISSVEVAGARIQTPRMRVSAKRLRLDPWYYILLQNTENECTVLFKTETGPCLSLNLFEIRQHHELSRLVLLP
jgi:hypothetical protein